MLRLITAPEQVAFKNTWLSFVKLVSAAKAITAWLNEPIAWH